MKDPKIGIFTQYCVPNKGFINGTEYDREATIDLLDSICGKTAEMTATICFSPTYKEFRIDLCKKCNKAFKEFMKGKDL